MLLYMLEPSLANYKSSYNSGGSKPSRFDCGKLKKNTQLSEFLKWNEPVYLLQSRYLLNGWGNQSRNELPTKNSINFLVSCKKKTMHDSMATSYTIQLLPLKILTT